MKLRVRHAFVLAVALAIGSAAPAGADFNPDRPQDLFGVAVVEGPGTITSAPNGTTYIDDDPLWVACKAQLEAAETPGLPAPKNGGVFFPCFGPPIAAATTHFKGEGTSSPDPVNAGSFCASTVGPCISESTGTVKGNKVGDLNLGAYCGSSTGSSDGTFQTTNPADSPLGNVSYKYTVRWPQSAATILPLVGSIIDKKPDGSPGPNDGGIIVGFVSARTTNDSRGTCGRPTTNAANPTAGQLTFAVDGMTVSFSAT